MRTINTHIIHCSDSDFGDVKIIRSWHRARGFNDVGYHFIIRQDGEIEIGRTLDEVGAHCRGQNATSIGTCLIGKASFSQQQFMALKKVHAFLKQLYPNITAKPHNAFHAYKTCPNFDVTQVLQEEV